MQPISRLHLIFVFISFGTHITPASPNLINCFLANTVVNQEDALILSFTLLTLAKKNSFSLGYWLEKRDTFLFFLLLTYSDML